MNGKPVFEVPAKTVLNWSSGFGHKLLCSDPGLTFTCGTACAYSCCFCYVPDAMEKSGHLDEAHEAKLTLAEVVVRRTGAVEALRQQIVSAREGKGRKAALFARNGSPGDEKVIYSSPLVDVAANMELVGETVAACLVILQETPWHIRLLSKSNLLPKVAEGLCKNHAPDEVRHRLTFGVSTGTLDDKLARCFEQGTPLVSKRIQSLHRLQDEGFRTYGMICPSLPQRDYAAFAQDIGLALRPHLLEHVWAEVINLRGDSFTRTIRALLDGGFEWEANQLAIVSNNKEEWEQYSRDTFLAHEPLYAPGQLRFLQYVGKANRDWWMPHQARGAVLLGTVPDASQPNLFSL